MYPLLKRLDDWLIRKIEELEERQEQLNKTKG